MSTTQVKANSPGVYPVPLDARLMSGGSGVGILVTVPVGVTVSYTIQVSGDPPGQTPTDWNPHDSLGTPQSASANGNLQYPAEWIGLNVISISGGSIVMDVVQTESLPR